MGRQMHCQVCLSGNGEERSVTADCVLRIDLENSLNLQLLVTVSSLAICSPCCNLIEMWCVFSARARKNLAALNQNASEPVENTGGARLKSQTQDLSRLLMQVLQSTDGPCVNTSTESSGDASADIERNTDCSVSTLVLPSIKACSVVLNKNEVEKYLERHQSASYSSQHEMVQNLLQKNVTSCHVVLEKAITSECNTQESYCPLEMKIEIGSEPPSPHNASFDACSAPASPVAASLVSSSDNEDPDVTSQGSFDEEISNLLLDPSSGYTEVSVSPNVSEITSRKKEKRKIDSENDQMSSERKIQNGVNLKSASKSIENSTIFIDTYSFLDPKPQSVESSSVHANPTDQPQDFEKTHNTNKYTCTVCKTTFCHSYSLNRHYKSISHKNNVKASKVSGKVKTQFDISLINFHCEICNASFNKKPTLKMHIKRHLKQKGIILKCCDFCSKQFSSRKALTEHILTHVNESKYFCYYCKEIFNTEIDLESHTASLNCKNRSTCEYNSCFKKLASKQSYKNHVKNVHNVNLIECITTRKSVGKVNYSKKQYKCKICSKIFTRNYGLKFHLLHQHQLEHDKVHCYIEVQYKMEAGKKRKIVSKHREQRKLYCKICERSFSDHNKFYHHIHNCRKNKIDIVEKSQELKLPHNVKQNGNKLKICHFCSKEFSSKNCLTNHIITHVNESKYFCSDCKEIFNSKVDLESHSASVSCNNLNAWECNYCDKKLASKQSYKNHFRDMHNVNLIGLFAGRKSMGKVNLTRMQYKCKICNRIFPRKYNLQDHLLNIHQLKPDKVYCNSGVQCKICKHTFTRTYNFYRHMETVHRKNGTRESKILQKLRLTCNKCNHPYRNLHQLRLHMLRVHKVDVPRFSCSKCDSSFLHRRNLERHLKVSHSTGDFMCEICGASFSDFYILEHHIEQHQSADFACQVCSESFENNSSLKDHMFWKHIFPTLPHTASEFWKPDVLLLECDFCSETFTSEPQLEKHTFEHLKQSKSSSKEGGENSIDAEMRELLDINGPLRKFFPCFACNEEFSQFNALSLHITALHKGAEHMQCKLCEKSYRDKYAYIAHLQRAHTLNSGLQLKCPYCSHVLKTSNNFAMHFGGSLPPGLNLADCCVASSEKKKKDYSSYSCGFCENVYKTHTGKWKHVRDYHPDEWKHKCKFCGKKFLLLCTTMKHERIFHKEKFSCPYCKKSFSKRKDLKHHVQQDHDGKPAFFCELCDIECATRVSLKFHRSQHALFEFNSHKVQTSNELVTTDQKMLDKLHNPHLSSQNTGDFEILCQNCNLNFQSNNQLKIHVYTVHAKINCYSCIECGSVFTQLKSLSGHMRYCHTNSVTENTNKETKRPKITVTSVKARGKIYKCEKCGEQFKYRQDLYFQHVSICKPDIVCQGCGRSHSYFIRSRINMTKHETRCRTILRPYKCTKCPWKYLFKRQLQKHKWMHDLCWADKMHCSHCPEIFDSITKVLGHYTKCHMSQLPLPLFCKLCDFNCDNIVELKLHTTQHNQQLVHCNQCHRDVSVAQFKRCHILTCKSSICSICSTECGSSANLFLHVQQDHETGNHSCLLCLNSFPSESNLQQHMMHNHGQTSFKCDICKVNISYKENLRSHIKLHIHSKTRCRICGREFASSSHVLHHTLKIHKDVIPPSFLETFFNL